MRYRWQRGHGPRGVHDSAEDADGGATGTKHSTRLGSTEGATETKGGPGQLLDWELPRAKVPQTWDARLEACHAVLHATKRNEPQGGKSRPPSSWGQPFCWCE